MTNAKELRQLVLRRYELESELMGLQNRGIALEDQVRGCKYEKRQAKVALDEYELGGFRPWLDKLSGKYEDKRETAAAAVRAAEAALLAAQREQTENSQRISRIKEELEPLVNMGDPVELAQELPSGEKNGILQLEAGLCARKLLLALEANRTALENAQEWARPDVSVGQHRNMQKNLFYAQADGHAAACMGYMERIALCGILLEIHPYFLNPAGYIVGVASQYGQLDRINSALAAIKNTREQAEELIRQLLDPEE